jgi:hypothetical protein
VESRFLTGHLQQRVGFGIRQNRDDIKVAGRSAELVASVNDEAATTMELYWR